MRGLGAATYALAQSPFVAFIIILTVVVIVAAAIIERRTK